MNSFVSYYSHHLFSPFKVYHRNLIFLKKVKWTEGILLSWLFYSVMSFFNIAIFSMLNSGFLNDLYNGDNLFSFDLRSTVRFLLVFYIVQLITYPIWKILIVQFYKMVIKFFLRDKFDREELSERAVVHSLMTDIYYLIPFIGGVVRDVCSLINLYSSLRHNAKLSMLESSFIILSPVLFLIILSLASFNLVLFMLFLIQ